jgi:O-antigen ligase
MSTLGYVQPYDEALSVDYPETHRVLTQRPGVVDWLFAIYLTLYTCTGKYYFIANYYFIFLLVLLIVSGRSYGVERLPEFWIILGLVVWNYITAFLSEYFDLSMTMAWYETKIYGGYFVFLTICNSLPKLRTFLFMQILGAFIVAVIGAVGGYSVAESGGERTAAFEAEPNAGGWIITYAIIASLIVWPTTKKFWKTFALAFFGFATIALLASGSRGSSIAAFSAAVFYFLLEHVGSFRANWKIFLPAAITITLPFIVAVAFFPNSPLVMRMRVTLSGSHEDVAMAGRDTLIAEAFGFFKQHPIFGIGVGAYSGYTGGRAVAAHNAYMELLSTTGIVGFVLYFSMVGFAFMRLRRMSRYFAENHALRKMFKAAQAGVLALMVLGLFNEVNLRTTPNMQLAMLIGFSARLLWALKHDAAYRFYRHGMAEEQVPSLPADSFLPKPALPS